jgi:hypothetical protein
MNWKIFTTACINIALVSFPQNMIGCGPEVDPYDYYTSFFHQNLPDAAGYESFYYTGINFLYNENEPGDVTDILADEWATYCGHHVTKSDAYKFVNKFNRDDLKNLYLHLEKQFPLSIQDSVLHNSMTNYFTTTKDLEGLGYILYAKQVEPFVVADDDWHSQDMKRYSPKITALIKGGQQLYTAAKKNIFKLKYAYQIIRLAHYSAHFTDAIKFYDEYVTGNKTKSVLQPLSLALKAGALLKTGNEKEAAYLFSKSFNSSLTKRVSNYLGFKWSINAGIPRAKYLALCKNNSEKANMLALFALGSVENELGAMKEIYNLDPRCEAFQVLVVREINKLEEKYFTPALQNKKPESIYYFTWNEDNTDSIMKTGREELLPLMQFLHTAAQNKKIKNAGLFETGAAYVSYMLKDYNNAEIYLSDAKALKLTQKVQDQWALTKLLVTINEKKNIDSSFEEQLLPSIQWLQKKAASEKPIAVSGYYDSVSQWKLFYRNLMNEIIARRYHQQKDIYKEALAIGAADQVTGNASNDNFYFTNGLDFLQNKMSVKDVEKLYALMTSGKANSFENYLLHHNSIKKKDVIDFSGTAYLREYDYANAIHWLKKISGKKTLAIGKDPFVDLLYDREDLLPSDSNHSTTKLAFAQEMQQLMKDVETDKSNAAKYYKIATGLYNMTYYGHAWELVQYYRSGTDGYHIPENATRFQKEYYGCFSSAHYFEKAMNASTDKSFKARCLFMMAKCSQKQLSQPQDEYYNNDQKFKNNKYFPQLIKEYNQTPFFQEAYSSCSYLRDFIKNNQH